MAITYNRQILKYLFQPRLLRSIPKSVQTWSQNQPLCTNATTERGLLEVKEHDGLKQIIMNDSKTRNSLSFEMMSQLIDAIQRDNSSQHLRCITIEAASGPVFSAGHNLKELDTMHGRAQQEKIFSKCTDLMMCLKKSEVPVIAVVKGLAAAAGCQLVSACDFAIAGESAKFSTPGASFGLFCSTPGIGISRAMSRTMSAFMVITGQTITAQEALNAGLVVKVVPDESIDLYVRNEVYESIKTKSRAVMKLGREFFYHQLTLPYEKALRSGENIMVSNLQMTDSKEGISSFKEKRKAKWTHVDDFKK